MSIQRTDRGIETEPDSEDPGLTDDEIHQKYSYMGAYQVLKALRRLDVVRHTYQHTCTNCQNTRLSKKHRCPACNAINSYKRTYTITFRLHQRDPIRE